MAGRFFIVGAYIPTGGAYMIYHAGLVAHSAFDKQVLIVNVSGKGPQHGIFRYPKIFPEISVERMLSEADKDDYLLSVPAFSNFGFGLRFPGRKIMYAQGFSTFSTLDVFFHQYLSVSPFVKQFVENVYSIQSDIIPAFVQVDNNSALGYYNRPKNIVLYHSKDTSQLGQSVVKEVLSQIQEKYPSITFRPLVESGEAMLTKQEIISRLSSTRYFLSLSITEGFGLIPLEAMGCGAILAGFDGFGGQIYTRYGYNSMAVPYGKIRKILDGFTKVYNNEQLAITLIQNAKATASEYSYSQFRDKWIDAFQIFFGQ